MLGRRVHCSQLVDLLTRLVYRFAWGRWGPPNASEGTDWENSRVPRWSCTQDVIRFGPAEQYGTVYEIRGKIVGFQKTIFNALIDVFSSALPHSWTMNMVGIIMTLYQRASAQLKLLKRGFVKGCLAWFRHTYVSWICIRRHSLLIHDTNSLKWVQQTIVRGKRFIFQGNLSPVDTLLQ